MSDTCSSALVCPNCQQPMQAVDLERHDHAVMQIDLCFQCAGLWFDHLESVQLAPTAVIELFKSINQRLHEHHQPLGHDMACPRCRAQLQLSQDLGKGGRFSYFRCPRNDGRFTPFLQFLREKQFVRNLTETEIRRVRAEVRQLTCSDCGAPIDLEHETQCRYCHAAISFIDPDAVEKAMHIWSDAEGRRQARPPQEAVGAASLRLPGANTSSDGTLLKRAGTPSGQSRAVDLIGLGILALAEIFTA